jgi:crotonobetainyl-CoA:carnitine CoA-transferase CaiB-like acyl-CoA transferase
VGVSCFDAKLPLAMRLPLSGITVLSLEQAIAAPLASRHLADWGARVIKIERPDNGDFARGYTDQILAELGLPLGHSADREAHRS